MFSRPAFVSSLLLALLAAAPAVRAQDAGAGQDAERPLSDVLHQIVEDTGVGLAYDPALVRGQSTRCQALPAAPDAALRCALGETGLTARLLSSGTYLIEPAGAERPARYALRGTIRDAATDAALPGATLSAPRLRTGAVADASGRYQLALPSRPVDLQYSHVGYARQTDTLHLRHDSARTVRLRSDPVPLSEVRVGAEAAASDTSAPRTAGLYEEGRGRYVSLNNVSVQVGGQWTEPGLDVDYRWRRSQRWDVGLRASARYYEDLYEDLQQKSPQITRMQVAAGPLVGYTRDLGARWSLRADGALALALDRIIDYRRYAPEDRGAGAYASVSLTTDALLMRRFRLGFVQVAPGFGVISYANTLLTGSGITSSSGATLLRGRKAGYSVLIGGLKSQIPISVRLGKSIRLTVVPSVVIGLTVFPTDHYRIGGGSDLGFRFGF